MKEKLWDLKQTKSIQAICIIGIMLHHLAQKTCAPWLQSDLIRHGLDFFVPIGYLFVAVFFFSSGYGLLESYRSRENYLDGFIGRHFAPIILIYLITEALFWAYGSVKSPYTWFIAAILYLYLVFYLSFRFCKKTWIAIAFVALGIVLYCVVCDWMVLGGWWFNTVGLFLIGLLYAENEDKVNSFIGRYTYVQMLLTLAVLVLLTRAGDRLNNTLYFFTDMKSYTTTRIEVYLLQFVSGIAMVYLCLLISKKVRFNSKVLLFIGSMTLELYLVHGFFVELFGFSFVLGEVKPLIFIKNVWLYTLVVFACSIASAYLLKLIRKGAGQFVKKESAFFRALKKDARIVGLVLLGIVVLTTAFCKIREIRNASAIRSAVEEYKSENIRFADACGKNMAAYVAGDGGEVIVILRDVGDPCPTISMKKLADELSADYTVIVLDYLGSGFSDNPDTGRNVVNITEEIHSALQSLGVAKPYILMPEMFSGMYAQYYAEVYPEEVKMVFNIDAESAENLKTTASNYGMSICELMRNMKYDADVNNIGERLIDALGWDYFLWPVYEDTYAPGFDKEDSSLASYFFFKKIYNRYSVQEISSLPETISLTENLKYSRQLNVIEVVSTYWSDGKRSNSDIVTYNYNLCQSKRMHHYENVVQSWYCMTDNTESIKEIFDKYLHA